MHQQKYKVTRRVQETNDTVSLFLRRVDDLPVRFVPGQFITVYFPEAGTPEGKSYSLSGAPDEEGLRITVKAMGEFSHRLTKMQAGDIVTASLPYGFFFSDNTDTDIVLVAAGIGIAPFRSMLLDALNIYPSRKIILYYTCKRESEIIFKDELEGLASTSKQFSTSYFLTQEGAKERIDVKKLVENLPRLHSPEFFLCGSIEFVRDMWKGLKENGVPEDAIFTEAFFSH